VQILEAAQERSVEYFGQFSLGHLRGNDSRDGGGEKRLSSTARRAGI